MPPQLVKRSAKLLSNLLADVVGGGIDRRGDGDEVAFVFNQEIRNLAAESRILNVESCALCSKNRRFWTEQDASSIKYPRRVGRGHYVTAPLIPYLAGHVTLQHVYRLYIRS